MDFIEDFTQHINRSIMAENHILSVKVREINELLNDLYVQNYVILLLVFVKIVILLRMNMLSFCLNRLMIGLTKAMFFSHNMT